jgi:hypothetical protein
MKKLSAILLLAITVPCFAIPQLINYQGYLTDPDGAPLDTTVMMQFSILQQEEGGSPIWTETHSSITVTDGVFHVLLGSMEPLTDTFFNGDRWLGITIGTDTELIPRQRFATVPYAHRGNDQR